jgi:hypothetical protein
MYFLDRFLKNTQISNFMKIRPVGAEIFHAEGRTDMTKLTVPFCKFANAPETDWLPALPKMRTAHFTHQLVEQQNTFINVRQWRTTVYAEKTELHYHMKRLKINSAANIPHKRVSGQVPGKWNTCITLHPVTNTVNAKTKQLTYRIFIASGNKTTHWTWAIKKTFGYNGRIRSKYILKVSVIWNIEMCTWVRSNGFPDDRDSKLLRNSGNQRYTNPKRQSPCRLNFVRWGVIFVGPKYT